MEGFFGQAAPSLRELDYICNRASRIAWRLIHALRVCADADPCNAAERSLVNDVNLTKLIYFEMFMEKEGTINIKKLLEYLLNDITGYPTCMLLRHVNGHTVAGLITRGNYMVWICPSPYT